MRLYDYFRSSASYRVRIALHMKNISFEQHEVHLVNNGGEQHSPAYQALNPQELLPCLQTDEFTLTQSLAILEYLEECHPAPPLLPANPKERALARSMAQLISCDIHPLNNLRVLNYFKSQWNIEEKDRLHWYRHWIETGFSALEAQLTRHQSQADYCIGSQVSIADICLIPQVYNAHRFEVDMRAFPRIQEIVTACNALPAFIQAAPENQSISGPK